MMLKRKLAHYTVPHCILEVKLCCSRTCLERRKFGREPSYFPKILTVKDQLEGILLTLVFLKIEQFIKCFRLWCILLLGISPWKLPILKQFCFSL